MEDVLEVYQRPADPKRPLIYLDEFAKQLLSETRTPLQARPSSLVKHDSEYVREGSVTVFMLAMPHLAGFFPEAGKVVIVIDNLITHNQASLYKAFPPEKARMLCERFDFHHTPAHGSWLNMAEIEIGLLVRGCLDRRIESAERIGSEVAAYLIRKNGNPVPIKWQFKNEVDRIKLHSVYPSI